MQDAYILIYWDKALNDGFGGQVKKIYKDRTIAIENTLIVKNLGYEDIGLMGIVNNEPCKIPREEWSNLEEFCSH